MEPRGPMIRRSAVDCLRRAGLSLRANWPLVLLSLLQSLVVGLLFVASLVPIFLVLGGMALIERDWNLASFEEWVAGLGALLVEQIAAVSFAVVASTVIGLLAVLAWGWFQGGIFGTLVAAERQALPDAQRRAGGSQWFRTYGWPEFSGWGALYAWRYFWFFHLSLTVGLVLMLVGVLIAFGTVLGYQAWGGGAAYGIGCGASLPFFFALVVYAVWSVTSQPFLARPGSRVTSAAGAGLRIIGRRPGAVLLIVAALFVVGVAFGLVFFLADQAVQLAADGRIAVWAALFAAIALVRMLVNAALGVFGSGAFASLAVAEAPEVVR